MRIQRDISGRNTILVMRHNTVTRLASTCFHGVRKALAGNLAWWMTPATFFSDIRIAEKVWARIERHISAGSIRTQREEIEFDFHIGWSSTDDIQYYDTDSIEPFAPTQKWCGMRVLNDCGCTAPLTTFLTLVFEIKYEHDGVIVIVHTMYPGRDVGELRGDMSESKQIVFFDFDHEGQPLTEAKFEMSAAPAAA